MKPLQDMTAYMLSTVARCGMRAGNEFNEIVLLDTAKSHAYTTYAVDGWIMVEGVKRRVEVMEQYGTIFRLTYGAEVAP